MLRSLTFNPIAVPRPALVLGLAGLIPFAAAYVMTIAGPQDLRPQAALALAAYGAVILSFLGGIHWGMAMAASSGGASSSRDTELPRQLVIAVLPSLSGWAALLLPQPAGLWLLTASFLAMFALDVAVTAQGLFPRWYPALRLPLSAGATACLMAGALLPAAT